MKQNNKSKKLLSLSRGKSFLIEAGNDMNKRLYRQDILEKLKAIDGELKTKIENDLFDKLTNHPFYRQAKTIGLTSSQTYEWATHPIILHALANKKRVCLPLIDGKNQSMEFREIQRLSNLKLSTYNINEPDRNETKLVVKEEIDLMLVPGLVFDSENYRIGHGGGYYDRYLANFSGHTLSLSWRKQIVPLIPREDYDIPVQELIISELE